MKFFLLFFMSILVFAAHAQTVTTIAGDGRKTSTPHAVTFDAAGNIYISDILNGQIRKISPNGQITIIIGATYSTWQHDPHSLVSDKNGNLYYINSFTYNICKITPDGDFSILAGSGTQGNADGTGANAKFYSPASLAIDTSGNLYVADTYYHGLIRKITPEGVVSTLSGTKFIWNGVPSGGADYFVKPTAITVDRLGNLYVADMDLYRIFKISTDKTVTILAGSGKKGTDDGAGLNASFTRAASMCIDNVGNLYVSDWNSIRKISSAGLVTTLAGNGKYGSRDGIGIDASFCAPHGLYVDTASTLYVAESGGSLRKILPNGQVSTVFGRHTDGKGTEATLSRPKGIVFDRLRNAYITDKGNNIIRKISADGVVSTFAGGADILINEGDVYYKDYSKDGVGVDAVFGGPGGIAIDTSGNLYVSDEGFHKIRKITPSGIVTTLAGSGVAGNANGQGINASFNSPDGIAVDIAGNVYVADVQNHVIRKITPWGIVSVCAGSGERGEADGLVANASFDHPYTLAIDKKGNLYVGDQSMAGIRKITSDGIVSSIRSNYGVYNWPAGIVIDPYTDALYVNQRNTVTKVTQEGHLSIIAGSIEYGNKDSVGTQARFNGNWGIAFDNAGDLYVTDFTNDQIRKIAIDHVTGVKDKIIVVDALILFPNPVRNILNIKSSISINSYQITDMTGRELVNNTVANNSIDVSNLNSGIYFIKASTEKGDIINKFIKE